MKFEPDVVRELLLWAEENLPRLHDRMIVPVLQGRDEQVVSYHCLLAFEAGLFDAIDVSDKASRFPEKIPQRLTWEGHQYLETVRDGVIWKKAKEGAKQVGSFSIQILLAIAKSAINERVKALTGYDVTS
jgi:hypothetical protein